MFSWSFRSIAAFFLPNVDNHEIAVNLLTKQYAFDQACPSSPHIGLDALFVHADF